MTKGKPLTQLLQNILTFILIFLVVQFVYNYFFAPKPAETQSGLIFKTTSSSYELNRPVQVTIENYTTKDLSLGEHCPNPPFQVQFQKDGQWQDLNATAIEKECTPTQNQVIPSKGTATINLAPWSNELFQNLGQYRLVLEHDGQTYQTTDFEVTSLSFFSWIWQTLLTQPIYNILIFFGAYLPFHDLGLAIILLTLLFRTILLIPNQKALKSQRRLQSIQPKMEEIKEKHKGDQEKIAMATLALYKEEKVNPFGSCLPLLIQLPILIAIYSVVQGGISHQHEFLLYPFFQNLDTSIINTNFLGILELTQVNIYVLPFLVGGLQFLQTKLAMGKSKSNNKSSSEMEVATKTMTYTMPVMIAIFTASAPAGVGLYWLFNTLYAIIQQLFVNKQVDQQSTSIRLADQDRHKSKKEEYAAKQQARLAQKAAQETKSTESSNDHQDDDHDDHQDPPIIKIKA